MRCLSRLGIIGLALCSLASAAPTNNSLPAITANDNRTPAGELRNGILSLRLELREGRWYRKTMVARIEMSTHLPRQITHHRVPAH